MSATIGAIVCPTPLEQEEHVELAHGGGGRKTARLIDRVFVPAFRNEWLDRLGDGAVYRLGAERLAISTDTFVVHPLFFAGGDIGSLAVHGTVNDLAMCGAEPLFLSAALILEEGFPIASLERIVASMAAACAEVGVPLVTGDTKVVDRGKGDGVFVNTTGVGRVRDGVDVAPANARPGDRLLVSGPVGDHGMTIVAAREGIGISGNLRSDSAHVLPAVRALLDAVPGVRVLRDPTRGGLATALCEIAAASGTSILLRDADVPVRPEVRGACELLGFDPLYVACEGRFLAIVPAESADAALAAVRSIAPEAVLAGEVTDGEPGRVRLRTRIGSHRVLERLSGEQLPRIC